MPTPPLAEKEFRNASLSVEHWFPAIHDIWNAIPVDGESWEAASLLFEALLNEYQRHSPELRDNEECLWIAAKKAKTPFFKVCGIPKMWSYGNNVNTLVESWDTTSTISDHADYESTYASKIWNSSGIISQSSGTYGYHEATDTDTSDLTETTETNDGFQPQYLMGSVLGLMTITPVTGWNPSTATKFVFSTPTLSVSGASDASSLTLPELVMTTTDFAELGVAADNIQYGL